jgi:ribose transport system permease protein
MAVEARAEVSTGVALARKLRISSLLSSLLFGSRFVTIWLAIGVLFIVCAIFAPAALEGTSWSAVLPLTSVVAVAALGQMLVVMTGGIDLSMAGAISLLANMLVGYSHGSDDQLLRGILIVLGWAVVIGLANGIMVAIVGLNPLIVTLAMGLILLGITYDFRLGTANESTVPPVLSDWVFKRFLGVSWVFWLGLLLTIILSLVLRSTSFGRHFQAVGANSRAAWIAGIHVRGHVVFAYVASTVSAGVAGILIAGIINSPGVNPGEPYLFGPIAAVVLAGASLTGGLSSVMSTWAAAFFLTLLNQMNGVLGLKNYLEFIVFGCAIIIGMVISGDRISAVLSRLLQRPSIRALVGADEAVGLSEAGNVGPTEPPPQGQPRSREADGRES